MKALQIRRSVTKFGMARIASAVAPATAAKIGPLELLVHRRSIRLTQQLWGSGLGSGRDLDGLHQGLQPGGPHEKGEDGHHLDDVEQNVGHHFFATARSRLARSSVPFSVRV